MKSPVSGHDGQLTGFIHAVQVKDAPSRIVLQGIHQRSDIRIEAHRPQQRTVQILRETGFYTTGGRHKHAESSKVIPTGAGYTTLCQQARHPFAVKNILFSCCCSECSKSRHRIFCEAGFFSNKIYFLCPLSYVWGRIPKRTIMKSSASFSQLSAPTNPGPSKWCSGPAP